MKTPYTNLADQVPPICRPLPSAKGKNGRKRSKKRTTAGGSAAPHAYVLLTSPAWITVSCVSHSPLVSFHLGLDHLLSTSPSSSCRRWSSSQFHFEGHRFLPFRTGDGHLFSCHSTLEGNSSTQRMPAFVQCMDHITYRRLARIRYYDFCITVRHRGAVLCKAHHLDTSRANENTDMVLRIPCARILHKWESLSNLTSRWNGEITKHS